MPEMATGSHLEVTVTIEGVRAWEQVYLIGSVPELGNWNPHAAFQLTQEEDGVWKGRISFAGKPKMIEYRYFIGAMLDPALPGRDPMRIVIKWEAQLRPRRILLLNGTAISKDAFGYYDGRSTIGDGWLSNEEENAFYVRIHGKALELFTGKGQSKVHRVKLVPFDVRFEEGAGTDESETMEIPEIRPQNPSFSETELSVLTRTDPVFGAQYQNGSIFRNNVDYLVFRTRSVALDHLAFCIELYEENGTQRVGVAWALPAGLSDTWGKAKYAIINKHQQPIGQINIDYMRVGAWKNDAKHRDLMSKSFGNHWKKRTMVEVGHRGSGVSYSKMATARENTIFSLNKAAQRGADFVELDVQLTKDHFPVVYHDFHVLVEVAHRKNEKPHPDELAFLNHHELAVKELKYKQLKLLSLEHTSHHTAPVENLRVIPREGEDNQDDHQPFPLLSDVLQRVDHSAGINIEIKYPMLQSDGLHECANYFERNLFIDRILDEVYANASDRRIVFSSFDPDICTLISIKQHKYPVLYLVLGSTTRYVSFEDMRCDCSMLAANFAAGSKLLGINFHSEELLKNREPFDLAKKFKLITFVWGDDNNEKSTQDYFKKTLAIDGIIYDRIGEFEDRKNIFVVEKEAKAALFERSAQATPVGSRRGSLENLDKPCKDKTSLSSVDEHSDHDLPTPPKSPKRANSLFFGQNHLKLI